MRVMGTAGHVDHGKSSLVRALTGIDPDRLPEEKARGLTIDLGFADLTLPNGERVGIVDVPGHERFVKNMIAGVGAIDFVVFVVGADDGWMPQSSEHYEILRYLGVSHGLVALTKIDLVEADWAQLVADDIRSKLEGGPLAGAAVYPVDSLSGKGLDELRVGIAEVAARAPGGHDIGRPRLFVDRVFTMVGRGAVVTGTLTEGSLTVGSEVVIAAVEKPARIRELQVHGEKVASAHPPTRVAVNLTGDGVGTLARGRCVVAPGDGAGIDRLIAEVDLWAETSWPLKAGRRVLMILGTAEVEATITPFAPPVIEPGRDGLVELRLDAPVKARWGDRFVLRLPTPQVTIGGGRVLDFGARRHGAQAAEFAQRMERRREHTAAAYLETEIERDGFGATAGLLQDATFTVTEVEAAATSLVEAGRLTRIGDSLVSASFFSRRRDELRRHLEDRHRAQPQFPGLNAVELQGKLGVSAAFFALLAGELAAKGELARTADAYHLPGHRAKLPAEWGDETATLTAALEGGGFSPPLRDELESSEPHGRAIVAFYLARGDWVSVGEAVVLPSSKVDEAQRLVAEKCETDGSITAAMMRDMLGTTRKYAVPLMEYFDRIGFTVRHGDERVLAKTEESAS